MTEEERVQQMGRLLADAAAVLPAKPSEGASVSSWVMIGLTGTISLLSRLTANGLYLGEGWLTHLKDCQAHLAQIEEAQRELAARR